MDEEILPIASMITVGNLTDPVLQLPMLFVLMPNPINLAHEGPGLVTDWEGASERPYVFVDMLRPVRLLVELLDLIAQWTLELRRESLDWREQNSRWELCGDNCSFWKRFVIVV